MEVTDTVLTAVAARNEALPPARRRRSHRCLPQAAGGENAKAESGDGAHHYLRGSRFRYVCPAKCGRYHNPAAPSLQSQRHIPGTLNVRAAAPRD